MTHPDTCCVPACEQPKQAQAWMCSEHWGLVPSSLRAKIETVRVLAAKGVTRNREAIQELFALHQIAMECFDESGRRMRKRGVRAGRGRRAGTDTTRRNGGAS